MEKGYPNATALLGGTAAWKNAGYPMEGGAASINNNTNKNNPNSSNKK
jgi:3-mercaptopyruvate sulfurtransferase SseA